MLSSVRFQWLETEGSADVRVILIAVFALLAGCASAFAKLYSEIPQYKGQNIDALVDRIGYPESQLFVSGRVVYTWTTASTVQTIERPNPPYVALLPPQTFASRSEPEIMSLRFPCKLQVDTDGTGTILNLSWVGKPGSCAP
jgi:hypothetical protein